MVKGIVTDDLFLALGNEEDYKNYDASSNKKEILKIAKQLQKIGDFYEVEHEVLKEDTVSKKLPKHEHLEHALSVLKEVFKIIDVIFDWFESAGNLDACEEKQDNKEEGVLRGLFHLLGFGNFASFVYEIASKFLDIPENYGKAKREHIVKCLKAVEDQKLPQVLQLVTEAGEILKSIIKEHVFNLELALQFDNIVRQVKDVIESCKDYLATAEKIIQELTESITIIKRCSRGLRVICFVVVCYVIYNSTSASSLATAFLSPSQLDKFEKIFASKLDLVFKIAAYAAACFGFAFLSLFASRTYILNDSLASLKYQHDRITHELQYLERKLESDRKTLNRAKEFKLNTHGH